MPPVKPRSKPAPKPGPPKAPTPAPADGRPVKYPEVKIVEYREFPDADHFLTVQDVDAILGWEEEGEGEKFGKDYEEALEPLFGKKVRLRNNTRNRPIDVSWLQTLAQEHLNRRWRMNWDTIVITKTEEVQNGQHRLISLKLAEALRLKDKGTGGRYQKNWPGPVTMEALVVFGAEDDDDVFRTHNCGKPMSPADVFFRSPLLSRFDPPKRRALSRSLQQAVQLIWERTGKKVGDRLTVPEADDFLRHHPRLVRASEHVFEETSGGGASKSVLDLVKPGFAAGLLFLFAASASDPQAWREAKTPSESLLDLSLWGRAEEFFSLLFGQSPDLKEVRWGLGQAADDQETGTATTAEYRAILCRAWNIFRGGGNPTRADCKLEYERNGDGELEWVRVFPDVGGIDYGPRGGPEEKAPATVGASGEKPTIPSRSQKEADRKADEVTPAKVQASDKEVFLGLKADHAGKVLLFKSRSGDGWRAFEQDAKLLKEICGLTPVKNGILQVAFPSGKCGEVVAALQSSGYRVAAVFSTGDGVRVEDYEPPADPPPNGKSSKPAKSKK